MNIHAHIRLKLRRCALVFRAACLTTMNCSDADFPPLSRKTQVTSAKRLTYAEKASGRRGSESVVHAVPIPTGAEQKRPHSDDAAILERWFGHASSPTSIPCIDTTRSVPSYPSNVPVVTSVAVFKQNRAVQIITPPTVTVGTDILHAIWSVKLPRRQNAAHLYSIDDPIENKQADDDTVTCGCMLCPFPKKDDISTLNRLLAFESIRFADISHRFVVLRYDGAADESILTWIRGTVTSPTLIPNTACVCAMRLPSGACYLLCLRDSASDAYLAAHFNETNKLRFSEEDERVKLALKHARRDGTIDDLLMSSDWLAECKLGTPVSKFTLRDLVGMTDSQVATVCTKWIQSLYDTSDNRRLQNALARFTKARLKRDLLAVIRDSKRQLGDHMDEVIRDDRLTWLDLFHLTQDILYGKHYQVPQSSITIWPGTLPDDDLILSVFRTARQQNMCLHYLTRDDGRLSCMASVYRASSECKQQLIDDCLVDPNRVRTMDYGAAVQVIYVLDWRGNVTMSGESIQHPENGRWVRPAQLSLGMPVFSAGELKFKVDYLQGDRGMFVLCEINNRSGHYRPNTKGLSSMRSRLFECFPTYFTEGDITSAKLRNCEAFGVPVISHFEL